MKTILVIVLIFIGGIQAFGQGIEFFKGDYNAALEKAKQEGKMLFVDFYVDWCGPCKRLAKDVFTLEAVGNYFNEKFVLIKRIASLYRFVYKRSFFYCSGEKRNIFARRSVWNI